MPTFLTSLCESRGIVPDPCRVAHIVHLHRPVGGIERGTLFLSKIMQSRGYQSIAYCLPTGAEPLREFFEDNGLPTATFEHLPASFTRSAYLRASWELARDLRRRQVDIIHCCDVPAALAVAFAARLSGIPLLCHVRVLWQDLTRRDCLFLWHVRHFAFVSEATRDCFAYKAGARRGTVVYDSVTSVALDRKSASLYLRTEFGIAPEQLVIGMVARIGHHKDHRVLIEAASILRHRYPNLRFLLLGDSGGPEHEDQYQRVLGWLGEFGVSDLFQFSGHRTDIEQLTAGLDIAVLATKSEALGLAVLEAMVQGTPFVGTRIGGVSEMIHHETNGLLHSPGNALELSECLQRLVERPAEREAFAAQARLDFEKEFSPAAYATRMDSVYRRMLL